jgi:hypothetical protein
MFAVWIREGYAHSIWRQMFVGLEDEARAYFARESQARRYGRLALVAIGMLAEVTTRANPPSWP